MNTPPPSDRIKDAVDKLLTPLTQPKTPAPAPNTITVTGNDNVVATGNITINHLPAPKRPKTP